jgi:hypothetical protein
MDQLSASDEAIIDQRIAEHTGDPESAIPLDDFIEQVRARYRS